MRSSVSPGQVVRWLFLIDWMNITSAGLKHAAWRNWANYVLVFFVCTMELAACAGVRVGISGMYHWPSDMFCLTVRMMFLFFSNTWREFLLKMAWQSSSHIWPTDIQDEFCNSEKTWVSVAAGGSARCKQPNCSGSIVLLSGSLTRGSIFCCWKSSYAW